MIIINHDNYLNTCNQVISLVTTKVANSETISFSSHHQKLNPKLHIERKTWFQIKTPLYIIFTCNVDKRKYHQNQNSESTLQITIILSHMSIVHRLHLIIQN